MSDEWMCKGCQEDRTECICKAVTTPADQPKPCEMPEEIWIDFTEDQYGNLSLLEWSSEKDKGIKYTRADRTPSPSEEDVREAIRWAENIININKTDDLAQTDIAMLKRLIRAALGEKK